MSAAPPPRPPVALGLALMFGGACLAVLIGLHPETLRAPAWVAFTCAALFGLSGVCVIFQAMGRDGLLRWLVCAILGGMVIVPGWIALGGGPRQCTLVSLGGRSEISEVLCRGTFGLGAAILLLMFILAVRDCLRPRRPPP